jgi:hypothetical protein
MAKPKKISRIEAPFSLICNKDISCKAFYLYIILRLTYNDTTQNINIYPKNLLQKLNWKDNKTLKKYLKELKDNNYITYDFTDLPIKKEPIQIYLTQNKLDKEYSEVDRDTIQQIIDCCSNTIIKSKDKITNKIIKTTIDLKEHGLRLFYFYEKNYNQKCGYAYPTYQEIFKNTGVRSTYIKALNYILLDLYILYLSIKFIIFFDI